MDVVSGNKIWQLPEIMERILKFMNAKDLRNCAQVCSLWYKLSVIEKSRRRNVEWFLEVGIGDGNQTSFQEQLATIRTEQIFCWAFMIDQTVRDIDKVFPCFKGTALVKKKIPKFHHGNFKDRLKAVEDCFLKPLLPVQCQVHLIADLSVIGCQDNGSPVEINSPCQGTMSSRDHAISGLLLPDFPGVSVHHYAMTGDEDFIDWKVDQSCLPNTPIKCLLILTYLPDVQHFIDSCVKYNGNPDFALGGAVIESPFPAGGLGGSCFVFAGENLEAASVVIEDLNTDVAKELELFKKTGLLENGNHCFAFMFSHCERKLPEGPVPNTESGIFKSMYPNVPLAGLFVLAEIGGHYLPNVDKADPDNELRLEKFPNSGGNAREGSSVFILLSVKKPIVSQVPPVKK